MRTITNKEFEEAHSCLDNIRIIETAVKPFKRSIPTDELESCKLIGLWEAMRNYSKNSKSKFTTFLYQRIIWECLNIINKKNVDKFKCELTMDLQIDSTDIDMYDILHSIPREMSQVVFQKYFCNMTLKEIGAANGYSHETARRILNKALEQLREICK